MSCINKAAGGGRLPGMAGEYLLVGWGLTKIMKRSINESMKIVRCFAFLAIVVMFLLPARVEGGV